MKSCNRTASIYKYKGTAKTCRLGGSDFNTVLMLLSSHCAGYS